jgi:glyceraldehyde 3-phosphate dehydrogenase
METFVNDKIFALQQKETPDLKWNEVDVDVVAECTGFFTPSKLQLSTLKVVQKK